MRRLIGVLALGACGACGAGGGAAPDASTIDAVPRQTVAVSQVLPGQNLIEGTWTAGPHDSIGISIAASDGTFDFDIHGHAHGGTQDITSGFAQAAVAYDFVPTEQAQWYLLVRNSTATTLTIEVHMDLFGAATWNGWQ